jgi:hypothetical protein
VKVEIFLHEERLKLKGDKYEYGVKKVDWEHRLELTFYQYNTNYLIRKTFLYPTGEIQHPLLANSIKLLSYWNLINKSLES